MITRIEVKKGSEWQVRSHFDAQYPEAEILKAARAIGRILVVRVTRAADAVSAPEVIIWDGGR